MVQLPNVKRDKNGVLILNDFDIEIFAYRQLKEFDPHYFDQPHPLDVERFVEFYLNINIRYYALSSDRSILGATALADGKLQVITEDGEIESRYLHRGDIYVDLKAYSSPQAALFTTMHEAWHSQFDVNLNNSASDSVTCLSLESSETLNQCKTVKTFQLTNQWMEHHANRYATYTLMPKAFVKSLWKKMRETYFPKQKLAPGKPNRTWKIINEVARCLNVSATAMAWRVKDLGLISSQVFNSLNLKKGGWIKTGNYYFLF